MSRYERHIFVCENNRPDGDPRGSCADKNSNQILTDLKKRIAELGLNQKIRVNSCGCLGACGYGPSMVIYPEQTWYGRVNPEDTEEIINSHILKNTPVERLLIKDPLYNKKNV